MNLRSFGPAQHVPSFDSNQRPAEDAIVAVFDLQGFSDFCNHADRTRAAPGLIAKVFDHLGRMIHSRLSAWAKIPEGPSFCKYTGDGGMMIWRLSNESDRKLGAFIVAAMRDFQKSLKERITEWEGNSCTSCAPKVVRVGIARGHVYPLYLKPLNTADANNGEPWDYCGYCINLAFRLQAHDREFGFLVQKSVVETSFAGELQLHEFESRSIRGCGREELWMYKEDWHTLDDLKRRKLTGESSPSGASDPSIERDSSNDRMSPILRLEEGEPFGIFAGVRTPDGVLVPNVFIYHLRVKNLTQGIVARRVRVMLVGVQKRKSGSSEFYKVPFPVAYQFNWAPSETHGEYVDVSLYQALDFVSLFGPHVNKAAAAYPVLSSVNSTYDYFIRSGETVRFELETQAENCSEVRQTFEVSWNGLWDGIDESVMRKNLSIREVSPSRQNRD